MTEVHKPENTYLAFGTESSGCSLDETLTWLINFSKEHGYERDATNVNRKLHINSLRVVEGCSVVVEHEYFEPFVNIRKRTDPIFLGDFDLAKIQVSSNMTDAADNPLFLIKMERSDSARKIQGAMEMSDGSKKTVLVASEFFYMDSPEAAERFKKALAHAITLCGGKRAPF